MKYNNGEGTDNRDDEKYLENYDEAFNRELHKDTVSNTKSKRQVTGKDLPVGMKSRTIYGTKK